MKRVFTFGLVCAVLVSIDGCGVVIGHALRGTETEHRREAEINASLSRYRLLVIDADADRLADMFQAQGELSHGDEKPHAGREAIRTFLKSAVGDKTQAYELRATSTKAESGQATQNGSYSQTVLTPTGETIKASGSFTAEWVHQADGRWLLQRMHTQPAPSSQGN